ncbi:MAG: S8 family peptidase [Chitinophagaceae bacterium]|nr:S8 family peptidase [Chitinophagaceae bacterium]
MQRTSCFLRLTIVKSTPLLFLFIFFCGIIHAQRVSIGATFQLAEADHWKNSPFVFEKDGEQYVSVLIETNQPIGQTDFHKTGIRIRSAFSTIATADVPLKQIARLKAMPEIKRIELPLLLEKNDTTMKKMTMVDKVHRGLAPLPKPFKGKGIFIGIIDDGLDFSHPEFLDSNGNTRVTAYWNMDRTGTPPPGFDYGTEISVDSIQYYTKNFRIPLIDKFFYDRLLGYSNHGTTVGGLAAGKEGVAPEATIGVVALTAFTETLLRGDRLLDAIQFLYAKAVQEQKKCVINISLGTSWGGPHDGKTLIERAIDQFCFEKPDLLIVSSAGNDGNNFKHWGNFPIHKDSSYTFFYGAYQGQIYVSIPKQFTDGLSVSLTDTKLGKTLNNKPLHKDSIVGQTPYVNIKDLIDSNKTESHTIAYRNGMATSSFGFAASHYNEDYDELIIDVKELTSSNTSIDWHLFRLIFKGEGRMVHVYFPFLNMHPAFLFNQNPLPNDPTFKLSDNDFTTIIPTNARSVLSAGAYNIRQCYVNLHGKFVNAYRPCQLTYFTSRGPTFDGRVKPEILTPGENVLAPSRRFENFFGHEYFIDSMHTMFGGTSASSPIAAGIAALLWEALPIKNADEIKELMRTTTYSDAFTMAEGQAPSARAGWGKADAFKAITGISTFHDSLCRPLNCYMPPPPSPDPPPPQNVDPPPPAAGNNEPSFFFIRPNPVTTRQVSLLYKTQKATSYRIMDITGRILLEGKLAAAPGAMIIPLQLPLMPPGVYLFQAGTNPAIRFVKL